MPPRPLYTVELCERPRGKKKFWSRTMHRNGNIIQTSQMYVRRCDRTRIAKAMARDAGWPVVEVDGASK